MEYISGLATYHFCSLILQEYSSLHPDLSISLLYLLASPYNSWNMPGTTTKVGLDPVDPVKVAVVQAEPSWFDVDEAVERTCEMISEAGKNGARLIAFPELWIPGYPTFIFAHDQKGIAKYHVPYFRNALEVESSHMARIRCSARSAKIMVVIGYAERAGGSLYMSQTFIGDDGSVLLHRRKFKPTHMERFIFGDGVSPPRTIPLCLFPHADLRKLVWRDCTQCGPDRLWARGRSAVL